ncbi:23252_t:CDS:1, partial [Racocetra persica]
CENDPSEETQTKKIEASNQDYLFYIADPSITNEIKEMVVYSPSKGPEERTRLYQDYKEEFSELRRVYGIRHLTSKKEERQNNPEIELNEAQFIALERDKKREREKSIWEFEKKVGCQGEHILSYGTSPEQREEKVLEVKEMEEVKEETREKSEQLEQKETSQQDLQQEIKK